MTATETTTFTCETCGKGGFASRQALAAHAYAHLTMDCPDCGQTISRRGLGPHRRGHGAKPRKTAPPPEHQAIRVLLGRLVSGDALARLVRLVAGLDDFPIGAFVVIGDQWGPHLTNRLNVGQVVESSREACVVLPLAIARALAAHEATRAQS